MIYAADQVEDWTSPEVWKKANPNLEVTIQSEEMAQKCRKAQETPAYENTFRRLCLNIWTEQSTISQPPESWGQPVKQGFSNATRG